MTLNYIVPLLISNLVDLANSLPTFYDHMVQFVMSLEDKGILKTAAIEKYLNSVLKICRQNVFKSMDTTLFSLGTLTKMFHHSFKCIFDVDYLNICAGI